MPKKQEAPADISVDAVNAQQDKVTALRQQLTDEEAALDNMIFALHRSGKGEQGGVVIKK